MTFQACIYREIRNDDTGSDEGTYYRNRQIAVSNGTTVPNEFKGTNIFQINALGFSARFYIAFDGTQMIMKRLDLNGREIKIIPAYDTQGSAQN